MKESIAARITVRSGVPAPAGRGAVPPGPPGVGGRPRTSTSTTTSGGPRCPSPGGLRELADLAGDIAGHQLDRSKPLWEMWIVEGLADGRIGFVAKMHHSTVDGVSGAALLSVLFDLEPEPGPEQPPPERPVDERIPSGLELMSQAAGGPDPAALRDRPATSSGPATGCSTCARSGSDAATRMAPGPRRPSRCPRPGPRSTPR